MQVKKLSSPGRYADGNCLYLTVSEAGSKSWLLRIVVRGRRRDMGLGSVDLVSLEEARDLARQYRRIARSGGDPLLDRQALRGQLISFREAAVQVHELNVPSWGNDKHAVSGSPRWRYTSFLLSDQCRSLQLRLQIY